MTRYFFVFFNLIILISNGIGQDTAKVRAFEDQFLRDYFRPTLKRTTLITSLTANSLFNSRDERGPNRIRQDDSRHLYGIDGNYFRFVNDSLNQRTINASFLIGYEKESNERRNFSNNTFRSTSSQDVELELRLGVTQRHFYRNQWYLEIRPSVFVESLHRSGTLSSHNTRLLGTFSAAWGKGRIEDISDAWSAQRIIEDLQRTGFAASTFTEEDFWEFADLIAELRNLRRLDFRMKRVYELEQIGQFLIDKEIIGVSDILFMAQLADTYRFERFVQRSSGESWNIYTQIYGHLRRSNNNADIEDYNLEFGLNYQKYLPIKKRWQLNLIGNLSYQPMTSTFFGNEPEQFRGSVSGRLGYYPSARTNLGVRLFASWNNFINNIQQFDSTSYTFTNSFEARYFISPFASLSGDIQLRFFEGSTFGFQPFNTNTERFSYSLNFEYIFL